MRQFAVIGLLLSASIFLASCSGGGGGSSNAPLPSAGDLAFSQAAYGVNEDGTPVQSVTISRTGGSAGAVTVDVALANGTATGGAPPVLVPVDFDNTTQTVSFADGDMTDKTITVPVLDDDDVEGPETVSLSLANVTGGAGIGALNQATLTIIDDDNAGTISFSAAAFSYGENGAPIVALTVTRTGGVDGVVGATITSTDGTAKSNPLSTVEPQDFVALITTVGFANQDATPQTIVLNGIVQDSLPELDETFTVTLSSFTGGAAAGTITTAAATIVDDDATLTINNPTPAANEKFGSAVVKVGATLAVGAPGEQSGAFTGAGAVRMFNPATGAATPMVFSYPFGGTSQNLLNAAFGSALLSLGTDLVISSPGEIFNNSPIQANGTIYVFDSLTGAMIQSIIHPAFGNQSDTGFGSALALYGTDIIAGAPTAALANSSSNPPGFGPGRVYVCDSVTGLFDAVIDGPPNAPFGISQFGQSVAVMGSTIFIGMAGGFGTVYGIDAVTHAVMVTFSNPFPTSNDHFGQTIAVFNGKLVVGAPDDDTAGLNRGAVYVFDPLGGPPLQTILPPASVTSGRFGNVVAVVRDRLCIQHQNAGTNTSGQVAVYDSAYSLVQTISNPTPTAGANFGAAMAEYDGEIMIGCPLHDVGPAADAGIVYVVKLN